MVAHQRLAKYPRGSPVSEFAGYRDLQCPSHRRFDASRGHEAVASCLALYIALSTIDLLGEFAGGI